MTRGTPLCRTPCFSWGLNKTYHKFGLENLAMNLRLNSFTTHMQLMELFFLYPFFFKLRWHTAEVTSARAHNFTAGLCFTSGTAHIHNPSFSNGLCQSILLFLHADMETAPSSIKLDWATTTPSSLKSMRRSTLLIRLPSTQAITPIAMITTWLWFVCHREQWAKCLDNVYHSVVTFFPHVCQWSERECSNRPATVTSPAGVTQVKSV